SLDFAIARLNSDGTLDNTFNGNGLLTIDFAGFADQANAVTIQGDGAIVIAGSAHPISSGDSDFAFVRVLPFSGALDPNFGNNGKQTINVSTNDTVNGVVVDPNNGQIDFAGNVTGQGFFGAL